MLLCKKISLNILKDILFILFYKILAEVPGVARGKKF